MFGGMGDEFPCASPPASVEKSVVNLDDTTDDESSEISIVSNETPRKKKKNKTRPPAKKSAVLDVCVICC